jgi:hypothetical protein
VPLYNSHCPNCGKRKKFLVLGTFFSLSKEERQCKDCGVELVRDGTGPSTSVKEVLDNGAMPRAVERFADTEDMMAERNRNADPNAGRKNYS